MSKFEQRTRKYRPESANNAMAFYHLALVPSFDEYSKKVEPRIDYTIDLTQDVFVLTTGPHLLLAQAKLEIEARLKQRFEAKKIGKEIYDAALANTYPNLEAWIENEHLAKLFPNVRAAILEAIEQGRWDHIIEAFRQEITFGTAGIRGKAALTKDEFKLFVQNKLLAKILKGPNTINEVVLLLKTAGVIRYMKKHALHKVAIGYDSRIAGAEFAEIIAQLFIAASTPEHEFIVYLFDEPCPFPELSFGMTTRAVRADIGILISASHNPCDYNGYKITNFTGAQLSGDMRNEIVADIASVTFADILLKPLSKARPGELRWLGGANPIERDYYGVDLDNPEYFIDMHSLHVAQVKGFFVDEALVKQYAGQISLGFSAYNGAGRLAVPRLLAELGFENTRAVSSLQELNGTFPAFGWGEQPDPGDPIAADIAVREFIKEYGQEALEALDLFIGTDPDADRAGFTIPVPEKYQYLFGKYKLLSANDAWTLLIWYRLMRKQASGQLTEPGKHYISFSHVTTDALEAVARYFSINSFGFMAHADKRDVSQYLGYPQAGLPKGLALRSWVGFTYIGETAAKLRELGLINEAGCEESNGFSILGGAVPEGEILGFGGHVNDKDGTLAGMLLTEVACYAASQGKTLFDLLVENIFLNPEIGLYVTANKPLPRVGSFEGAEGITEKINLLKKVQQWMQQANAHPGEFMIAGRKVLGAVEFARGAYDKQHYPGFPDEGVRFFFADSQLKDGDPFTNSRNYITIRPSGTSQTIRFYVQSRILGLVPENAAAAYRDQTITAERIALEAQLQLLEAAGYSDKYRAMVDAQLGKLANDPARPLPGQPMPSREETDAAIKQVGWDNAQILTETAPEVKLAVLLLRSINEDALADYVEYLAKAGLIRAGPYQGFLAAIYENSPAQEGIAISNTYSKYNTIFERAVSIVHEIGATAKFSLPHDINSAREEMVQRIISYSCLGLPVRPEGLIFSHEIREVWNINYYNAHVSAGVEFFAEGEKLGLGQINIDQKTASIHTCYFKSFRPGQKLAQEFAARLYIRAFQISRVLGFETKYAHAFYTLSEIEERDLEELGIAGYKEFWAKQEENYAIFRHLGLEPGKLMPPFSGCYSEHVAPLDEVVAGARANWKKWFYENRVKAIGSETAWKQIDSTINWLEIFSCLEEEQARAFSDILAQLLAKAAPIQNIQNYFLLDKDGRRQLAVRQLAKELTPKQRKFLEREPSLVVTLMGEKPLYYSVMQDISYVREIIGNPSFVSIGLEVLEVGDGKGGVSDYVIYDLPAVSNILNEYRQQLFGLPGLPLALIALLNMTEDEEAIEALIRSVILLPIESDLSDAEETAIDVLLGVLLGIPFEDANWCVFELYSQYKTYSGVSRIPEAYVVPSRHFNRYNDVNLYFGRTEKFRKIVERWDTAIDSWMHFAALDLARSKSGKPLTAKQVRTDIRKNKSLIFELSFADSRIEQALANVREFLIATGRANWIVSLDEFMAFLAETGHLRAGPFKLFYGSFYQAAYYLDQYVLDNPLELTLTLLHDLGAFRGRSHQINRALEKEYKFDKWRQNPWETEADYQHFRLRPGLRISGGLSFLISDDRLLDDAEEIIGANLTRIIGNGIVVVLGFGNIFQELINLAQRFPEATIHGIEWVEADIRAAQEAVALLPDDLRNRIILHHNDFTDLKSVFADGAVKLVYSRGVLDRIILSEEKLNSACREIYRILGEGGLLISIPNDMTMVLRSLGMDDLLFKSKNKRYVYPSLMVFLKSAASYSSAPKHIIIISAFILVLFLGFGLAWLCALPSVAGGEHIVSSGWAEAGGFAFMGVVYGGFDLVKKIEDLVKQILGSDDEEFIEASTEEAETLAEEVDVLETNPMRKKYILEMVAFLERMSKRKQFIAKGSLELRGVVSSQVKLVSFDGSVILDDSGKYAKQAKDLIQLLAAAGVKMVVVTLGNKERTVDHIRRAGLLELLGGEDSIYPVSDNDQKAGVLYDLRKQNNLSVEQVAHLDDSPEVISHLNGICITVGVVKWMEEKEKTTLFQIFSYAGTSEEATENKQMAIARDHFWSMLEVRPDYIVRDLNDANTILSLFSIKPAGNPSGVILQCSLLPLVIIGLVIIFIPLLPVIKEILNANFWFLLIGVNILIAKTLKIPGQDFILKDTEDSDAQSRQFTLQNTKGITFGFVEISETLKGIRLDLMVAAELIGSGIGTSIVRVLRKVLGPNVALIGQPGGYLEHNRGRFLKLGLGPIIIDEDKGILVKEIVIDPVLALRGQTYNETITGRTAEQAWKNFLERVKRIHSACNGTFEAGGNYERSADGTSYSLVWNKDLSDDG
ncbi:MAG: methyltransferase domain-containing protein, partial [Candidatus Omnitrophica bacterium]|nr:methyltransferase domain-containing protein [Candidatus Omnitrophota bacterium]